MTLGQFAAAVGASRRWVLNALTRLGVPRNYSEPLARRLALARLVAETAGARLPEAFALAGRALADAEPTATWRVESPDGSVALVVDLPRFFTTYGAALARARTHYGERRRGRRPRQRGTAVERAKEYGIDVTLLHSALQRTPEQRLKLLAEDMEFLEEWRKAARKAVP
ncbi:MAG: hypothetical protein HYR48_04150 [Gemmatimonadetes bacterium]|nr:hypothetical protein [Gemmatimonadota bacterium]